QADQAPGAEPGDCGQHGAGEGHRPPDGQSATGDGTHQAGGSGQGCRHCAEADLRQGGRATEPPGRALRSCAPVQADAPGNQTSANHRWAAGPRDRPQSQRDRSGGSRGTGRGLGKGAAYWGSERPAQSIDGQPKLYAWHAPEVDCISKGKARRPYEFGVKVGIASTFKGNLIVGARAFHRNPYDGHTLSSQLEQATILMQDCAAAPETVFVDLGYRGVDADNPGVRVVHRGKPKRLTAQERRQLKRRQAIEPIIGHLKADHRMDRCHLKGEYGDRLHAVLCAAGYNIKWLLRMIAKKGVPFLRAIFLCLAKGTM